MAIAVVMDFEGGNLDQYDRVIELMGFAPGGQGAPGGLFHWVTRTDTGVRVTDVWESREQFERFAQEQIGPFSQQAGIEGPPAITFFEVHNYLTAG
jgi:hypothetical protein